MNLPLGSTIFISIFLLETCLLLIHLGEFILTLKQLPAQHLNIIDVNEMGPLTFRDKWSANAGKDFSSSDDSNTDPTFEYAIVFH